MSRFYVYDADETGMVRIEIDGEVFEFTKDQADSLAFHLSSVIQDAERKHG